MLLAVCELIVEGRGSGDRLDDRLSGVVGAETATKNTISRRKSFRFRSPEYNSLTYVIFFYLGFYSISGTFQ